MSLCRALRSSSSRRILPTKSAFSSLSPLTEWQAGSLGNQLVECGDAAGSVCGAAMLQLRVSRLGTVGASLGRAGMHGGSREVWGSRVRDWTCRWQCSAAASAGHAPASVAEAAQAGTTGKAAAAGGVSVLLWRHARSYYELSKTKLSVLVVATAGAGFVLGSGETVDWSQCALTCCGTFLTAASANTLNQILEVRNDAAMRRTQRRPLPSGRITPAHALAWAVVSGAAGTALLLRTPCPAPADTPQHGAQARPDDAGACGTVPGWCNILPGVLAASNIVLYAGVYTPLKQLHVVNTWVGALVGGIPPLIGWTAASGEGLGDVRRAAGAWLWGTVLFLWQLPHFFALSWMCKDDYTRGGYKMLSVLDRTGRRTAAAALGSSVLLLPLGPLAAAAGVTTLPFAVQATVLSLGLTAASIPFLRSPSPASARSLFRASLLFLPAYMGAMAYHRIPHSTLPNYLHSPALAQVKSSLAAATMEEQRERGHRQSTVAPSSNHKEGHKAGSATRGAESKVGTAPHMLPPAAYASAAPFPFLPLPQ